MNCVNYDRYERLAIAKEGRVLRITLNDPDKHNALTSETQRELSRIFMDFAEDDEASVAIVTGKGVAFSAGGDIIRMQEKIDNPSLYSDGIYYGKRIINSMLDCPKPIICRLNGNAIGLGATIALFCDFVAANEEAKIGDPHVRVGLVAGDGGAIIWPQLVGYMRAKRYLLLGELVTGRDAAEMGLVTTAAPLAELDAIVDQWTKQLLEGAGKSIGWTKVSINLGLKQIFNSVMDAGLAYEGLANISEDHQEAVTAFREKRKPNFTGR